MDLFSFLSRSPERQIQKLRKKVKEPHGEASVRVNAAYKLYEMGTPEAISVLLERFTITVSPQVQDEEEKEQVLSWVSGFGRQAVEPIVQFLKSERQVYWPFRALRVILGDQELIERCNEVLRHLWENPPATVEPQTQLIRCLKGLHSTELEETIRLYLEERDDDILIAALDYLFELGGEDSRNSVLESFLESEDRPRVRTHILDRLTKSDWTVKGYRPSIETSLPPGYALTREGRVRKLSVESL